MLTISKLSQVGQLCLLKTGRWLSSTCAVDQMETAYQSKEIASEYIKYRKTYHKNLSKSVISYLSHSNTRTDKYDLMVDIGCGSGQSTNLFQPYFKEIIGTDVSDEQLKQAKSQNKFENIRYKHGRAEKIEVDDKSVDLIVSGTAAHWFNLPKFFKETKRVLKQDGCLAIFGHYIPELSLIGVDENTYDQQAGSQLLESTHFNSAALHRETFPCDLVKRRYADIFEAMPFTEKERNDSITSDVAVSVNDLCGLLRSFHHYELTIQKMVRKLRDLGVEVTQEHIDSFDIASQFKSEIIKLWKLEDVNPDEKIIRSHFTLFLLLARNS